jgi:ribulose-5-phosphate 4-epimerase/fuculose-1-phosphate aldolase
MTSLLATYRVTCNSCPHQVEGELIDGRVFYFKARYHHWMIGVGATIDDAIDDAIAACNNDDGTASGKDPHGRITYGDAPDEARRIIEAYLAVVVALDAKAAA